MNYIKWVSINVFTPESVFYLHKIWRVGATKHWLVPLCDFIIHFFFCCLIWLRYCMFQDLKFCPGAGIPCLVSRHLCLTHFCLGDLNIGRNGSFGCSLFVVVHGGDYPGPHIIDVRYLSQEACKGMS